MKKVISLILVLLLVFGLAGCTPYRSHYKAFLFVHSNERDNAYMRFDRFEGTMVFTLHGDTPGILRYSAKLAGGSATFFYDCGDGKTEFCSIGGGDAFENTMEFPNRGTVYIIVETDGACENGDFSFALE